MDRGVLAQLVNEAEVLLHRGETELAQQRERIETLHRAGQDAGLARLHLRRMESRQARHVADRNRLFKQLADRGSRAS